ncbi:MAG: nitrite/sulfite reductase [Alphaproteobacteria bacterium]
MYQYDAIDAAMVQERANQFRGQVARRSEGRIAEEEFRPLRLMNGLYLQLHAYMLRVAVPYGTLNADQMRTFAHIARKYDKGYGHFTTRQNIQYNWPDLDHTPDILDDLAKVEMHAIQTSGNCIRNITTDPYAGATDEEIEDPRIAGELMRQWSTFHPEFSYLPRKFKIAITGAENDRAAIKFHDIGIEIVRGGPNNEIGYRIYAGGGQGRTPVIAKVMSEWVAREDLISFLEAILRVYNQHGRRDNLYKARIKITVNEMGVENFREAVLREFELIQGGMFTVDQREWDRIAAYFTPPAFEDLSDKAEQEALEANMAKDVFFARWVRANTVKHRAKGYAVAVISLKPVGGIPGDATADQMDRVAELSDTYSLGDVRVTHEQNLVLPHVKKRDLKAVYDVLADNALATPNLGQVTDIICCPGLDYCNLANARSIPVSQMVSERFADLEKANDIGELKIKISGCINACGHHHVGHIGILGVDKKGVEFYQITLGGDASENAAIGERLGPAFGYDEVADAIETIVTTYLDHRTSRGEQFNATVARVGLTPFKEALYGTR